MRFFMTKSSMDAAEILRNNIKKLIGACNVYFLLAVVLLFNGTLL